MNGEKEEAVRQTRRQVLKAVRRNAGIMDMFKLLLRDSRFWGAVILLINAMLYYFVPTFPEAIWAAFNGVAAIIIGVLATSGSRVQARAARALKQE